MSSNNVIRHETSMARLKHLKNVAGGIAGSFVSRNNDFRGYWALGMLRSLAAAKEVDVLEVQLRPAPDSMGPPVIRDAAERYAAMLDRLLERLDLPLDSVAGATVRVDFSDAAAQGRVVPYVSRGEPVSVQVSLRDPHGVVYSSSRVTRCEPHNPNRESRSLRGADAV